MKKIISLISAVAIVSSMCSLTAFAANTRTVTLTAVSSANVGDEFEAIATLDTSNTVKTIGVKIAFDPNDIELGVSAESKAVADEYAEFIGTEDFPTLDDVTNAMLGRASYVSDTYANTYAGYAATKNLGTATIGYEEKDGLGKIAFGYAISTAKNALNKIDNMVIGGAVLKVKTSEKKQTTIKIVEAANSDKNDTAYNTIVNEVVINLNGYTGEEEDDDTVTATQGETVNGITEYDLSTGEKVMMSQTFTQQAITPATRFVVTWDGTERTFGSDLYAKLGGQEGNIVIESLTFGIVVDGTADVNDFTFAIN